MRPGTHRFPGTSALVLIMIGALVSLPGCGQNEQFAVPAGPSSSPSTRSSAPYQGSLYLAPDERVTPAEQEAGAAGRVVQCRTRVTGKIGRDVYEGAAMSSAPGALKAAASEIGYYLTAGDFDRERTEGQRVLYTYRVRGEVKQAIIVAVGPTTDAGKTGWHAETWASCDLSEYPDAVLASYGRQRWRDLQGQPVPTYQLSSGPGPEHCDLQSATFLHLEDRSYVGTPPAELIPTYVDDSYARDIEVPADATATRYVRADGDLLWIAVDQSAAYLGSPQHAERWPRQRTPYGCA